nr:UDP-glycosyltransferase [Paris polyphylla]
MLPESSPPLTGPENSASRSNSSSSHSPVRPSASPKATRMPTRFPPVTSHPNSSLPPPSCVPPLPSTCGRTPPRVSSPTCATLGPTSSPASSKSPGSSFTASDSLHSFASTTSGTMTDAIKSRLEEEDVNRPFVVPGLPDRIELTRAQVPGFMLTPNMQMFREEMFRTEEAADGVVVNSSDDLEPPYKEWYEKTIGKKVWTIGPMSMYNRNASEMALRGNKAAIDNDRCLSWLDSMTPSSVLYVSFGSLVRTTITQLIEIGLGLEASGHPFIWVIKGSEKMSEVEEWLKEFESRTSERGLIIKGWAPQVMILSHQAVGGFMTHCGWNSTLEGLSAGVPMITWPHFAEQFLNERLVIDVAKVGVPVGVKSPTTWALDTGEVMVKREEVERAVRVLMDGGKEGEERRARAKEMEAKARKTIEEGGSSFRNTTLLIQHIAAMETKIV